MPSKMWMRPGIRKPKDVNTAFLQNKVWKFLLDQITFG